ncbi:[protein-PII] uridylyltransferase [Ottowia testudinis]|uniref:Bifunctional uridylyltransferase/uridylyl-removing enzyme n=1 Tax=Ottowia testudinis TaxID=2816950 RepID=A0A975CIJ5_9BURK|nr:[protein-PII] uridylyltransferase [Ottowia testudinis]QTD47093.1 [protein-PII] uridylyltransferase [Ottowia testudinis]
MTGLAALGPRVQSLRAEYGARKTAQLDTLRTGAVGTRGIRNALGRLAGVTDDALRALWALGGFDGQFALVAVGGYGRGELFPYSDIDVLLLLPEGSDPARDDALRQRIERFISQCWDVGLEIGSSVRTVGDCLAVAYDDVTVQTALLEARLIVGNRKLFKDFQQRFMAQLDPLDFFSAKRMEMRQRHVKYEDTPYALEPNCKESPGGLRDLQIILWVARAAGIGTRWEDLLHAGLLSTHELRQLRHNEALLSIIRSRLHLIAGRREDRLVFDLQNAVAESFGFAHRCADDGRMVMRASEVLMRRYYWAAKAVTQLNQILLQNIEERLRAARGEAAPELVRINDRFFDRDGMIEAASDDLYERTPHAILETFLLYARTPGLKGLSARTLRALYNARTLMGHAFRADPINRKTFLAILQQPQGTTHAFRLMNQTSVLGRYLWVFRRIVGQMQHDLFHVYTVDQHILMVLRNARRFFMAEHAHEYPFCSQLAAGWDKPWILYIAALFHDVAKGRGGDHSDLGALEARRFCRDHGVQQADARLIEFLVRQHLLMTRIAQKEDLSDPEVIQAFARQVGNERYLTALYLLTVADVRGTSPKVWNAWKSKLLEDLYRLTVRTLGGRAPDSNAVIESRKRQALIQLALASEPRNSHQRLWDTLDISYFMRHDAGEIAWHTRQLARHVPRHDAMNREAVRAELSSAGRQNAFKTKVRARLSPVGEGLQVLVYASDRPDLFARICGYFDRAGFSILDAKIHTTRNGYALDTFQIISPLVPEHYREFIGMVEADLPQAVDSQAPLPAPRLGRVSRRVKSFPIAPRVDLRPDEKAQRWLLTVTASDRVGLLYSIARVLAAHGINLELAKVSTLGERVEDMFLLQGAQLQHNKTQLAIEQELLEVLEPN